MAREFLREVPRPGPAPCEGRGISPQSSAPQSGNISPRVSSRNKISRTSESEQPPHAFRLAVRCELDRLLAPGAQFWHVFRAELGSALRSERSLLDLQNGGLQNLIPSEEGACIHDAAKKTGGERRAVEPTSVGMSQTPPAEFSFHREVDNEATRSLEGSNLAKVTLEESPALPGSSRNLSGLHQKETGIGEDQPRPEGSGLMPDSIQTHPETGKSFKGNARKTFSEFVQEVAAQDDDPEDDEGDAFSKAVLEVAKSWTSLPEVHSVRRFSGTLHRCYRWWANLEEPAPSGRLARFVRGNAFEGVVCLVIFLNCFAMVVAANYAMANPLEPASDSLIASDWFFQIFYTIELLLKLSVHRQWFFCNESWQLNVFDAFLVTTGWMGLLNDSGPTGTFLRIFRMLKLAKALRAFRVMAQFKHLRTFLICLKGSLTPFLWSLVMLAVVLLIFSLFFMQMLAGHFAEVGQALGGDSRELFGSVIQSMLTLYMATTGGDDWIAAFEVVGVAGVVTQLVFILFIAFVQLALINIITGIFVEAAMQTLAPDREAIAKEHGRQQQEYARDLTRLCKLVDSDVSGKLTPEQFEEGIRKGRIPTLLNLLGLRKDHVLQFFGTMSEAAQEDGGQVDISKFVAGCMKLKGNATNFDMAMMHSELQSMHISQKMQFAEIKTMLGASKC